MQPGRRAVHLPLFLALRRDLHRRDPAALRRLQPGRRAVHLLPLRALRRDLHRRGLAALRCLQSGRRAVHLLPLRALRRNGLRRGLAALRRLQPGRRTVLVNQHKALPVRRVGIVALLGLVSVVRLRLRLRIRFRLRLRRRVLVEALLACHGLGLLLEWRLHPTGTGRLRFGACALSPQGPFTESACSLRNPCFWQHTACQVMLRRGPQPLWSLCWLSPMTLGGLPRARGATST